MKKFARVFLLVCLWLLCQPMAVQGQTMQQEQTTLLEEQLDSLDFSPIEQALQNSPIGTSFKALVEKALTGQLDLSPQALLAALLSGLFSEITANGALMGNLLFLCVISAVLRNLTESFDSKGVGELGFYVCYVAIILVMLSAFHTAVVMTGETIALMASFMEGSIPLVLTLMVASGMVGAPLVFSPTLIFAVTFITTFIKGLLTPMVTLGALMEIVNYISEKEILSHFSGLIKNICNWSLKIVTFLFVSVLTLQRLTAPLITNLVAKSARTAVNVVPVVGKMINGAWDMVLIWAQAIKGGVLAAFVVTTVTLCAVPVLKLLALIFIFKATAAIIQPVCDERIVKCLGSVGSYSLLLLGCLVAVMAMFVSAMVVLLSF